MNDRKKTKQGNVGSKEDNKPIVNITNNRVQGRIQDLEREGANCVYCV